MNKEVVEKFKGYFTQMKFDDNSILNQIYSDDIAFIDPIHEVYGIENLSQYFERLNDNLIEGSFKFTDESIVEDEVFLRWELRLKLKRPRKVVEASGISVLNIKERIIQQRDFFDVGELFYEHVPVLGSIVRRLKKKIAKG